MDWSTIRDVALQFVAIMVAFTVVLLIVAYTVLAERRVLGLIQGRLGPNRVGFGGSLQPFADLLKFILKEDIVPDKSTRFVYFLAPVIATMAALMTMIVYPFGPEVTLPFLQRTTHLRSRSHICRCLWHSAGRLVVKQQIQLDGRPALFCPDDLVRVVSGAVVDWRYFAIGYARSL